MRAWDVAGVSCHPVQTVYTVGIDTPRDMAAEALSVPRYKNLKIKLNEESPVQRLQVIRNARPDANLVVDANQGWSFSLLKELLPALEFFRVKMIEQPLPRGADEELTGFKSPIPLCADESCLTLDELDAAIGRYQLINIKLDKTGGLTAALSLANCARAKGFGLMVGNMVGTSLAMAPAFLIAERCAFVDLDGPLLLRRDRSNAMVFQDGAVFAPSSDLWG